MKNLRKIVGSRRGLPLLPLPLAWAAFALVAIFAVLATISWLRGDADAYAHEHARMALLAIGATLAAASGVVRRNRRWHVALFAGGIACLLLSAAMR